MLAIYNESGLETKKTKPEVHGRFFKNLDYRHLLTQHRLAVFCSVGLKNQNMSSSHNASHLLSSYKVRHKDEFYINMLTDKLEI